MDEKRSSIIITNLLDEILDKVFDQNYSDFYEYISTEIGITDEELLELRKNK